MSERLFVAFWPPDEVVAEVAAALPTGFTALRWQPAARWHITVAFLGQRSPEAQLARLDQLRLPAAGPLRLQGSGRFGPVLWIGIDAGEWLSRLAEQVQARFDVPDRRFRAHMTVARARSAVGQREVRSAAQVLAGFVSSPWWPSAVTLVRSRTGPQPSYEVIGRTGLPRPC